LTVTHSLQYGGGQLWLTELLGRMGAGRRFECTMLALADGPLVDDLEAMGIDVHVTCELPRENFVAYEGRLTELLAWASAGRFTAALVNTFVSFAGADLARRMGVPYVWAIHESFLLEAYWPAAFASMPVNPQVKARATESLGTASALVFEAEATRALYRSHARPGAAVVVPYGIDTAAVSAYCHRESRSGVRARLGIAPSDRMLLMLGTIEPRKAQTVVAEAFAAIEGRYRDAVLVFVGDQGTSYSAGLRTYIEEEGLVGRIRVEPVTDDTYGWYRAADALVCGSDVESLPRSVLEAMCFGIPVLATSVFGLPELIADGETGLLFEPLDLGAAIRALERLLDMAPVELKRIAINAQALVWADHDSAGYAYDIESLLREGSRSEQGVSAADILKARPRPARR
jgi:D-inositol-3-phosphate glycosyltransferase